MATKMGIVDYEKRVKRYERRIMEEKKISSLNKEKLQQFLLSYVVSPARKQIFLERIKLFLQSYPDVTKTLVDRDEMNRFFAKLRKKYAPATVATYVSVVRQFLRWLNDGDAAPSLRDVKMPKKSTLRRKFANQHPTWQEVETYASFSTSVQTQTMVAVLCDAGFRPSAFLSLNYGDISWRHGLPIAHVVSGKNGSYEVTLFRSVEYIKRWLQCHPTKKPNDPLWISEVCLLKTNGPIKPRRYAYGAVNKRFREIARKAGYEGAFDMYAMRHLSCANDKRDGIPAELAAARHNHSIKHFLETYGHIESDDEVKRMVLHLEHANQHRMRNSLDQQGTIGGSVQQQHTQQLQQPMQSQTPQGFPSHVPQQFMQSQTPQGFASHAPQYPQQPMGADANGIHAQQSFAHPQPQQQMFPPNSPLEELRQKQEQQQHIVAMATAHQRS